MAPSQGEQQLDLGYYLMLSRALRSSMLYLCVCVCVCVPILKDNAIKENSPLLYNVEMTDIALRHYFEGSNSHEYLSSTTVL